jgi:hypothetical protein
MRIVHIYHISTKFALHRIFMLGYVPEMFHSFAVCYVFQNVHTHVTQHLTHLGGLRFEALFGESCTAYCCMNLVCFWAVQNCSIEDFPSLYFTHCAHFFRYEVPLVMFVCPAFLTGCSILVTFPKSIYTMMTNTSTRLWKIRTYTYILMAIRMCEVRSNLFKNTDILTVFNFDIEVNSTYTL